MKVKITTDVKDGAPLSGENPLPIFRDRNHHLPKLPLHESLKERHKKLIGYECSRRVLPYRMQDRYGRKRAPMHLKTAVLENEHLRAKFYVNYGGRLTSLYDKDNKKELIKNNPVFQPGNLAIRDAWLATGIEFNCSQFGHHFLTCAPLYAAKVTDDNGQEFLRMYEYERCKGIFYQMDFHLPKGSKFLYLYAQIINPKDIPVSTYWWTNIDLPEVDDVRVFSATDEVIYYMSPDQLERYKGYNKMAVGNIPHLDCVPGVDLSYPRNYTFSTDYFFQIPKSEDMPWEAAAYPDGFVMYEVSTKALRFHKMFCWGSSVGGRNWQDYLSRPGEGNFFEIQAGLAPTQNHGYIMEPNQTVDFVQAFGSLYCDPKDMQDPDWNVARLKLDKKIRKQINGNKLSSLKKRFCNLSKIKPEKLLNHGSGFGALELHRRKLAGKPYDTKGMIFPDSSITEKQAPWLTLIETGAFPAAFTDRIPVSYMVDENFKILLEKALENPENRNWHSYLHYGIMQAEQGDFNEALKTFKKSMNCKENVWAQRNIAYIHKSEDRISLALKCYKKLFSLPGAFTDRSFSEEYMDLMLSQKKHKEAWSFFRTIPDSFKDEDRLALQSAVAAVEIDKLEYVENLLKREFSVIREGETSTSDIWFKYKAKMISKEKQIPYTEELIKKVKDTKNPPSHIDFRMFASLENKND